jgi:N-formylglutamate amidohydrolase
MLEQENPFNILEARAVPVPVIVSIPHTGTSLPREIAERLAGPKMLGQPMTDWHLHRLYDFLPRLGVTVLHATMSRFIVDLNRPASGAALYPGRFETGLVPLETFIGETIWRTPPDAAEIERLQHRYHAPYHAALRALLDERIAQFSRCYLIDCHSVASHANRLHDRLERDIYLGDRDGATCERTFTDFVAAEFERAGFKVSRNDPYKGGYITDHYGRLAGVEALQIEMCQRLYMDEARPAGAEDRPPFAAMRDQLHEIFERLVGAVNARDCRCG